MGVTKVTIAAGDGTNFPQEGDSISIHYIGCLYDETKADNHFMGQEFDSSRRRGAPFKAKIGAGQLIKGWEEGVPQMSLGEKAILTATSDYAYGKKGFPELIPPDSTLVFEVELININ